MGIKAYLFLLIIAIAPMSFSDTSLLGGEFKSTNGYKLFLSKEGEEFALNRGYNSTEIAENHQNENVSHCINFDYLDIVIPAKFELGEKHDCYTALITISKFLPMVKFGDYEYENVYVLNITRRDSVIVEEGLPPAGLAHKGLKSTLFYSLNDGLIAIYVHDLEYLRKEKTK